MDFEKLTNKSKELIQDVVNRAARDKHQYISSEHLLSVMLNMKDSTVPELLSAAGVNVFIDISSITSNPIDIFSSIDSI